MTKRRGRILFWAGIALVLAVIGLRIYCVACLRGPRIIRRWVQPDDVHYDEHDPYALALMQDGYELKWPLPRPRYYFVLGPSHGLLESGKLRHSDSVVYGGSPLSGIDTPFVAWGEHGPTVFIFSDSVTDSAREFMLEKSKSGGRSSTRMESSPSLAVITIE